MNPEPTSALTAAAPVKSSPYARLLRNRNFGILLGSYCISSFGDAFFSLALMWLVYSKTGSALQSSGIVIASRVSAVITNLISGTLVDRWNRRQVMVIADLVRFVLVAGLGLAAWDGNVSPLLAFACVFLLGIAGVFYSNADGAIMPAIVETNDLVTARGLANTAVQSIVLLGKAVGGVFVAAFGAALMFAVDAASFLISAAALWVLRTPFASAPKATRPRGNPFQAFFKDLRGGWEVVAQQPTVLWLMLSLVLVNAVAIGGLYPALIKTQLQGGVRLYGLIEATFVVGAIAAGLMVGWFNEKVATGHLFAASLTVASIGTIGMGLSTMPWLTVVCAFLTTFATTTVGVPIGALVQTLIPAEFLGRTFGFLGVASTIMAPVGAFTSGWLGDRFGPGTAVVIAGLWGLLPSLFAWGSPHIRNCNVATARSKVREVAE